jgi:hypothetical protein
MAGRKTKRQKCQICGKTKEFPESNETCSNKCGQELRRRRLGKQSAPDGHKEETRECPGCGEIKTFKVRQKFCSLECVAAGKRNRTYMAPEVLIREKSLKADRDATRKQLERVLSQQAAGMRTGDEIEKALRRPLAIPNWIKRPRRRGKAGKRVTAMAKFSDWHYGEVVDPAEVRYLNGYDKGIADIRTHNFFDSTLRLCFDYMKGFDYEGIVVPFLGDIVTGDIHEELRETNYAPTISVILEKAPNVAAGLTLLADHFGKVWVPVICGNHGRQSQKPRFKQRVETNFDWLFGEMVARSLEDDPRITVTIPRSSKYIFNVYTTTFLASHGDEARGGSGIASLLSPLMIADARMRKTTHYDFWLCGHWHQLANFKRVEVNGAGKGFDEYALGKNLDFDWPAQDLSIVDPKYSVVCHWPIRVIEPGSEPWMEHCPLRVPGQLEHAHATRLSEIPFSEALPGKAA